MTGTGYLFFKVVTEQPTSVFIWTVRLDQSQINTGSKKILIGLSYQLKGFKIRGQYWCILSTWTPQLHRNCSRIWICYTLGNVFFKVSADVHDLNILRQMKTRVPPKAGCLDLLYWIYKLIKPDIHVFIIGWDKQNLTNSLWFFVWVFANKLLIWVRNVLMETCKQYVISCVLFCCRSCFKTRLSAGVNL